MSVQREIYWAVREAIRVGMSVEDFRRECAEVWGAVLQDKRETDAAVWAEDDGMTRPCGRGRV